MDSTKDIEARITYQYPKGRFRFPLIPDEGMPLKRPVARVHEQRKQTEEKKGRVQVSAPSKIEKPLLKNELIQKKRSSGPFRPTEIPSPIFGFSRPVVEDTEIVEHELSHFFESTPFEDQDDLISKDEPSYILENNMEPPVICEQETISQEITEHNKIVDLILEENLITITEDPQSETETFAVNDQVVEIVPLRDECTSEELTETLMSEEAVQADAEPEKTKRSHLPFNVMMLKQDKQKWEQRRHREIKENPQSNIPIAERTEREEIPKFPITEAVEPVQQPLSMEIIEPVEPAQQSQTKEVIEVVEPVQQPLSMDIIELVEPLQQSLSAEGIEMPELDYLIKPDEVIQDYIGFEPYVFPTFNLLKEPVTEEMDSEWVMVQEEILNQTLQNFNVGASVVNVTQGPSVTRFEVQPEPGVKVNKVTNLTDDIKLSLAARDIRIEAPIPGKHTIGIEVPNVKSRPVLISEIIQSNIFREAASPLTAVLGLDISGKPIVTDLKKMPHGLIAGATGSGKSVCINTMIISLLYKASPEDLKLLLIDPKMVELAPYNHIPHLVSPVITDVKAATAALKWAVDEMERRYQLFAHTGVRDISRFNELAMQHKQYSDKLPFIVIVIDELADLMMMSPADVEEAICRIAQKARACGIHLIVATQRPSVDVITGLIKANIPTRIAFSVSSQVDSRTIIDISGAEKLLGRGDMLFLENGSSKPVRLQGTFVSDEEIDLVVAHIREQREPDYFFEQEELLKKAQVIEEEDELFYEVCEFFIDQGGASTSSLQRRFKIGYNRAARLMDLMEKQGYISGANGSKPREVLITETDLEAMQASSTN
ncbi:DNA translocase FtsK [Neobacillus sp. PS3-40]|nr:DNA translocase FtsK [Neobacillus sp. PS3-40]WML46408.1 DNA translocase FtsK [Neobacillus sp. PS3-40]